MARRISNRQGKANEETQLTNRGAKSKVSILMKIKEKISLGSGSGRVNHKLGAKDW